MKVIKDLSTFKEQYSIGGRKWTRTIDVFKRGKDIKKNIYFSSGDSLVYIHTDQPKENKEFLGTRRYFDVHYYLEGSEEIEVASKSDLSIVKAYSDETDREHLENNGISNTQVEVVNKGQIAIFETDKAYRFKPLSKVQKIVVKVTIEHNFFLNK